MGRRICPRSKPDATPFSDTSQNVYPDAALCRAPWATIPISEALEHFIKLAPSSVLNSHARTPAGPSSPINQQRARQTASRQPNPPKAPPPHPVVNPRPVQSYPSLEPSKHFAFFCTGYARELAMACMRSPSSSSSIRSMQRAQLGPARSSEAGGPGTKSTYSVHIRRANHCLL
ncbi:hypothetical protein LZ30DRAFT_35573 [Colletotrichum cereale]|nr:hypothetical protein LZ30DRAFT_35573 [Colletotrichum cereale]